MNSFEFLLTNESHLSHRLSRVAVHYSDWTMDRIFEETKRALQGLRANFQKENALLSTIHNTDGIEGIIAQAELERAEIKGDVDNLCMIHVDEPGFEQGLKTIADKFERHCEFCKTTLFPLLEAHAYPHELQSINNQIDSMILDG